MVHSYRIGLIYLVAACASLGNLVHLPATERPIAPRALRSLSDDPGYNRREKEKVLARVKAVADAMRHDMERAERELKKIREQCEYVKARYGAIVRPEALEARCRRQLKDLQEDLDRLQRIYLPLDQFAAQTARELGR